MWVYQQSSGKIFRTITPEMVTGPGESVGPTTQLEGEGYSGRGPGVNNPSMQRVHDVGPIPVGFWLIGTAHDHPELGPLTMDLTPEPETETYGRTDFRIHGDLKGAAPGSRLASKGCVVLPHDVRAKIAASGDYLLKVIK